MRLACSSGLRISGLSGLSISIDPKETFDLAQKKRENYLKTVKQKNISDKDFSFNVAKEEEVKRLAQALGF